MVTAERHDVPPAVVRWVVEQAARAPSIHNTQPWRFEYDDGQFRLYADMTRGLVTADPEGRELAISCGAALYNLRLALRITGRRGLVTLTPDLAQPRLLALIKVVEDEEHHARERTLFAALQRRHTRRGGFDPTPVPAGLSAALQAAAAGQGAELHYVHEPGPRQAVLRIAATAARLAGSDARAREETAQWAPERDGNRRDGVPAWSYPRTTETSAGQLAGRDFDLGRGEGSADEGGPPTGPVAALVTETDLLPDWLLAGQALEAVMVTAAAEWAFASLHTQACEIPYLREELRRQLNASGYPQLLLQVGFARTAPHPPRRHVHDIIDVTEPAVIGEPSKQRRP